MKSQRIKFNIKLGFAVALLVLGTNVACRPNYSDFSNSYKYRRYYNNYDFGNSFGSKGLPGNSFIANNNFFKNQGSSNEAGLLTNALFFGSASTDRRHRDRIWRQTTRGPYFENKVPGDEKKILPVAAVEGKVENDFKF